MTFNILSAASWLLDIPTGVWADLIGYRRLLLLARALELASLVVTIFAFGFWPFALGAVLYGAHLARASGCEDALVYASLPSQPAVSVSPIPPTQQGAPTSHDTAEELLVSDSAQLGAAAFALLGAANSAGFCVGLTLGSFVGARSPTLAVVATAIPMTVALMVTIRLSPTPSTTPRTAERAIGGLISAPVTDNLAASHAHGVTPNVVLGAAVDLPTRPSLRELLVVSRRLLVAQPALAALSLGQSASFVLVNNKAV